MMYRTRALITRGVYFFPIFHCGLYCRAVSITDNLCTKQGNSSNFGLIFDTRGVAIKQGALKTEINTTDFRPKNFLVEFINCL